jgi:putative ABC transport system ATP-binding protein
MTALLSLDNIRFCWPGQPQPALQIASLQIAAAERVFVIGPSGCGKTTLLSLIAGMVSAQAGAIHFAGQDLRRLSASQRDRLRADEIGIIFQLFNLLPYLSVLDNVLLTAQFSRQREQRAIQCSGSPRAEAERLLQRLGLDAALWQRPVTDLSVGQQQRVAAARALLGRPALLLADEPTSALDTQHRDRFIQLLDEECRDAGTALLFVSHDLNLAGHFSRTLDLAALNKAAATEASR